MLRLAGETRADWIVEVMQDLPSLLVDHAHCEKKAASMALSFMFRYVEHYHCLQPLSELAREELRHFEQVLLLLEQRGIAFERQFPANYAGELMKHCAKEEPQRMMDLFLCASLIEARSCERMKILSEYLREQDPKLAQFYKGLLACEARHHQIYITMLQEIYPKEDIEQRLTVLAQIEHNILQPQQQPPRMHS